MRAVLSRRSDRRMHVALSRLRLFFALVLALGHVTAAAQEPPAARLDYAAAPEGCPDEQAFRDLVTARLGRDPFEASASLLVTARIDAESGALHAQARITAEDGSERGARALEGTPSECRDLANALASAVALALTPPPVSVQAPVTMPVPSPAPVVPLGSSPPAPPPPREPRFTAHAGLAAGGGITPGFALSPLLGVGLRARSVAVLAEGRVDLMPGIARSGGERVEASVFSAGPAACLHLGPAQGCLGVELGVLQGRALDVTDPRTHTSFFSAAAARLGFGLELGPVLALRLAGELRVPLVRTALRVNDTTVWDAPALGGGLRLELAATFL
jgi:hypothetical protein